MYTNTKNGCAIFSSAPDDPSAHTNFENRKPATLRDIRCEEACDRLAVEAVKRGCTDNVTVMIVDITHPSQTSREN